MFFLKGPYHYELRSYIPGLVAFFLALIPAEILTDWIFYKNHRSTLAAILFHFSINLYGELFQIEPMTKVIQAALLFLLAGLVLVKDRKLFFTREFHLFYEPAVPQ